MASFKSILSAIGHFMEKVFTPKNIQIEASVADIAFPGFAGLINTTASAIINAENASIAALKQSGSGEAKLALVIQAIEADYTKFAQANEIPVIPANMQKYVDAAVAMLNSFPAPTVLQNTNSSTPVNTVTP